MTPRQIDLIRASWAAVEPISDDAARLFYDRLFALDPSLRALFPADLREQKRKLLGVLAFAVGALDRPAELLPAVERLGARHAGYGVRPEHYATVGQALGLDIRKSNNSNVGRPIRFVDPEAKPVKEILA